MKTTKIQRSAQGEECTLRIWPVCNYNQDTTILAHVGSGTAKRKDDLNAAYACSSCHDAIDYRDKTFLSDDGDMQTSLKTLRLAYIAKALDRTHKKLREKGLL
jgi:cytochrome c553